MRERLKNPLVIFCILLPVALVVEFFVLEGAFGISLPSDRGSAVSSYEVREQLADSHFITRNKRFLILDVWSNHGSSVEALVLRESTTMDRQEGVEGTQSTVRVEALNGSRVTWSFEESGEQGEPKGPVYEVTKFGCCGSPNTYTYFSLRDGKKLRSTHTELNQEEFEALVKPLYD